MHQAVPEEMPRLPQVTPCGGTDAVVKEASSSDCVDKAAAVTPASSAPAPSVDAVGPASSSGGPGPTCCATPEDPLLLEARCPVIDDVPLASVAVEGTPPVGRPTVDGDPPAVEPVCTMEETALPSAGVAAATTEAAATTSAGVATVPSAAMSAATTALAAMSPSTDTPPIATMLYQRILPDNLVVYTRKPRRRDSSNAEVSEFIQKISRPVQAIAPTPTTNKRRQRTVGPVSMPRRSRRLANLPPESDRISASTVCRKLGFASEEGRISDDALARYSKFYNHLLGRDNLAALSALFGWEVPSEGQARAEAIAVY